MGVWVYGGSGAPTVKNVALIGTTYSGVSDSTQFTGTYSSGTMILGTDTMSSDNEVYSMAFAKVIDCQDELYHRKNMWVLNKAGNLFLVWITRDTSGSETVLNLSRIGTIEADGRIRGGEMLIGPGTAAGQTYADLTVQATGNGVLTIDVAKAGTGFGNLNLLPNGGNILTQLKAASGKTNYVIVDDTGKLTKGAEL
jgi:hypothetical protein